MGLLRAFSGVVLCTVTAGLGLVLAAALWAEASAWRSGRGVGELSLAALALAAVVALVLTVRFFAARDAAARRERTLEVVAAAVSLLVALAVAEAVLARWRPAPTHGRVRELAPSYFRASDVLPVELEPGFEREVWDPESGRAVAISINRLGLRGPEIAARKPAGTFRVLVLGDSFAFNAALEHEELHTTLLEERLAAALPCPVEVLNAGFADGFAPDAYAAFLLRRGFALEPDLVVAQYFVRNDAKDLLETEVVESRGGLPWRVRSRYRYVDASGHLRDRHALAYRLPLVRELHVFHHLWRRLDLDGRLARWRALTSSGYAGHDFRPNSYGIAYRDVYSPPGEQPPALRAAQRRALAYLAGLDRESRRRGVGFAVFVVPTGAQMSPEGWRRIFASPYAGRWSDPEPQRQIHRALADVPVLDPLARLRRRAARERLYLGDRGDGHWTAAGARAAAAALYDLLRARDMIRCPGAQRRDPERTSTRTVDRSDGSSRE